MIPAWALIPAALALDALLGDPRSWPHPVRAIGACASACERISRRVLPPLFAGIVSWLAVLGATAGAAFGFVALASRLSGMAADALGWPPPYALGRFAAETWITYVAIAPRDLAEHALRVRAALVDAALTPEGRLAAGRKAVAMIVGRDVDALDEAGIVRAATESVAESLVDGVVAPLFWTIPFGAVGAIAYRAVNTMDSMFGHKDERYLLFGRVPARADDAANWLPARLSIPFIAAAARLSGFRARDAWRIGLRDGAKHASPNSGRPEAAFAGALGLRLAGPAWYGGERLDKPWMGDGERRPVPDDIRKAVVLMYGATLLSAAAFAAATWALRALVTGG